MAGLFTRRDHTIETIHPHFFNSWNYAKLCRTCSWSNRVTPLNHFRLRSMEGLFMFFRHRTTLSPIDSYREHRSHTVLPSGFTEDARHCIHFNQAVFTVLLVSLGYVFHRRRWIPSFQTAPSFLLDCEFRWFHQFEFTQ